LPSLESAAESKTTAAAKAARSLISVLYRRGPDHCRHARPAETHAYPTFRRSGLCAHRRCLRHRRRRGGPGLRPPRGRSHSHRLRLANRLPQPDRRL
jgi:hypothetical protein